METLEEYLAEFYTPQTAKTYKRDIQRFLKELPSAIDLVYKDLVDYTGIIRKRYQNPSTLNRINASIKVYYDYLSHTGQREDNPAKSIKLRDKKSRDVQLQDLFTAEELESLLESEERYKVLELRNKVLISLMIYQALSPKELEALKVSDVDLQKGIISINETPKTNSRELPLKAGQILLFHEYINQTRIKLLGNNVLDKLLISMNQRNLSARASSRTG